MRIIGGEARGRSIHVPKGCRIRPTADRVKESLFSILGPLDGASFLDLFAGSGNVGLEALSRGARKAVFVERNRRLAEAIEKNLQSLGFQGRARILAMEATAGLKRLFQQEARFDILFADPPYEEGFVGQTASWWREVSLVAAEGLLVVQHSVREPLTEAPLIEWTVYDQRRYGDTLLTFLRVKRDLTS